MEVPEGWGKRLCFEQVVLGGCLLSGAGQPKPSCSATCRCWGQPVAVLLSLLRWSSLGGGKGPVRVPGQIHALLLAPEHSRRSDREGSSNVPWGCKASSLLWGWE